MDTVEILIHDNHHPVAWPLFWTALAVAVGVLVLGFIVYLMLFVVSRRWSERVFIAGGFIGVSCIFVCVCTSAFLIYETRQSHHPTLDEETVAEHLKSEYGATQVRGGSTGEDQNIDPEDVSHNTYTANTITVGDHAYKDCQIVFTNPENRDKKSYVTMKVTCHNHSDEQNPIILKPTD